MREVVVSAATLAGLVGLACLYNNGSQRVRREADFESIDEVDYDVMDLGNSAEADSINDYDFIKSLGLFDDSSDMPEFIQEDIAMFQSAKGTRKSIQFITKCMKNIQCSKRADATVRKWGENMRDWMQKHVEEYQKPVLNSFEADAANENQRGICTPKDDLYACSTGTAFSQNNNRANTKFSVNADFLEHMKSYEDSDSSDFLAEHKLFINPSTTPSSNRNVFTKVGVNIKVVLIIPNGISVGMRDNLAETYSNYWGFFKRLNDNIIGLKKKQNPPVGRSNLAFWFIRQDAEPKALQKAPVKASSKFPWKRFESLMGKVANTAAQPNLKKTYQLLTTAANRALGPLKSSLPRGMDCYVLWFHQYLPGDLTDLAAPNTQENHIAPIERKCNIIHIWVGMDSVEQDKNTLMVTKFMQGILQPEQLSTGTAADPDHRGWFYVDSLTQLGEDAFGNNLVNKIYNIWMSERLRTRCMLHTPAVDWFSALTEVLEGQEAKQFDYDYYASTTTTTVNSNTTLEAPTEAPGFTTTEPAVFAWNTTEWTTEAAVETEPPNYACCGIGFGGQKYDVNTKQCCKAGLQDIGDAFCAL